MFILAYFELFFVNLFIRTFRPIYKQQYTKKSNEKNKFLVFLCNSLKKNATGNHASVSSLLSVTQEVSSLRQQILDERPEGDVPIVIVANKTDVGDDRRSILPETAESLVCLDWGNGYVEASAKDNVNIVGIFKEILRQSKVRYELSPAVRRRRESMPSTGGDKKKQSKMAKRRTQSVNT